MNPEGQRPLRVLYIVSLFPCWSETFIVREIHALIEAGVDVRILSLKPPSEKLVQPDAAALLDRVIYPRFGRAAARGLLHTFTRRPLRTIGTSLRVLVDAWGSPSPTAKSMISLLYGFSVSDVLRKFDPDFVHAHWATYPSTVAWALSRVLGTPFGFTCHAHDIFTERQLLARKIADAALPVTISRFNIEWLRRRIGGRDAALTDRFKVVHCGVDLQKFAWSPHDRKPASLLAVGRFDPIKGFDTLIQALALLQLRGVDFHCRLIGSGAMEKSLRKQAARLGLKDKIEFAGVRKQDEVQAWMRECTVFVMPSQVASDGNRDGIPVALMEAMASGCAVVSTRVSGIPELIEDGRDGLLVEQRQPQALADALHRLLSDPALRLELAVSARNRIETEFDARIEASRLHGYMREVLDAA